MAADLQPEWICGLPRSWSYGLTRDGRVFFVNEEAKSTTWLHPLSGEAVITGHRKTPDLPTGWEEGYTFEGARCFINCWLQSGFYPNGSLILNPYRDDLQNTMQTHSTPSVFPALLTPSTTPSHPPAHATSCRALPVSTSRQYASRIHL
ncbi:pleckstrin homology domain-containing family A member 5-like isoform X9 [Phyllopteryx taeniolatus]|uniref:pleckstrin homology domain-containing family A member 5-like isoform X9 n=1 Tax=Phyllopteryx taeniolatus TaxID=161469 RepID=UPI002AD3D5FA|nr:pleckstrin homology domain-containing family A member 5-like isoform X9 [Phyllopteryx taeniolatus]